MIVDLHCHLLPGIDDGGKDWETSLQLAQAAVADGITHAVLTPHHLNGQYINHRKEIIYLSKKFQEMLNKNKIELIVFPGQEVRLSGRLIPAVDDGDVLYCDENGRYILLELPSDDVPLYVKDTIFQLMSRGITPVIAHPERNMRILREPAVLEDLLKQGCLTQLTASSYIGVLGKKIQKLSRKLIATGQVACLASDAHDLPGRQYVLREALTKVNKEFGREVADRLNDNARDIVNGDDVYLNWKPLKRKQFWKF